MASSVRLSLARRAFILLRCYGACASSSTCVLHKIVQHIQSSLSLSHSSVLCSLAVHSPLPMLRASASSLLCGAFALRTCIARKWIDRIVRGEHWKWNEVRPIERRHVYAYAILTDVVVVVVVVYMLNSSRRSNSVLLWTSIQPVVNLFLHATKEKNSF